MESGRRPAGQAAPWGGFGGRRPPGSAGGRTALRAGSSLLRKFWSRESAGFPARQGAGEGRCRGQAKRGRAAVPGKSNVKWRACSLLGIGLLQGVGRPKGASAPPKPAALPPRPSCGRPARRAPPRGARAPRTPAVGPRWRSGGGPALGAPRPRGNSAKIHGYFGSRPSRRQVASRLCCSCAR